VIDITPNSNAGVFLLRVLGLHQRYANVPFSGLRISAEVLRSEVRVIEAGFQFIDWSFFLRADPLRV
jgi:hypothetical protein